MLGFSPRFQADVGLRRVPTPEGFPQTGSSFEKELTSQILLTKLPVSMSSITNMTAAQLWKAADLKERIDELQAELAELLGEAVAGIAKTDEPSTSVAAPSGRGRRKKRRLSAQGLANIRAGVARRQAGRARSVATVAPASPGRRGKLSAAGRRALSEKLKARWAARKAAGKGR